MYFAAIAEAGSIRGGAARLGLSVPVLSEALSELEADLGVTLALRTTRRFQLTESGETVRDIAVEVARTADRAYQLRDDDKPITGTLSLSLPVEMATIWLPDIANRFLARHPMVDLVIEADDGIQDLGATSIELALRTKYRPPGSPLLPGRDELVLVSRDIPAMERASDGNITIDGALIGRETESWLAAYDPSTGNSVRIEADRRIVINNRVSALAMAREGLGVVLVYATSAAQLVEAGDLRRLCPELLFGSIELGVVFRDAMPAPPARAFADFLEESDASVSTSTSRGW